MGAGVMMRVILDTNVLLSIQAPPLSGDKRTYSMNLAR